VVSVNLAFDLDLDKDTVRRVLATHYCPDPNNNGPSTPVDTIHSNVIDIKDYRWDKYCRGLFDLPVAA